MEDAGRWKRRARHLRCHGRGGKESKTRRGGDARDWVWVVPDGRAWLRRKGAEGTERRKDWQLGRECSQIVAVVRLGHACEGGLVVLHDHLCAMHYMRVVAVLVFCMCACDLAGCVRSLGPISGPVLLLARGRPRAWVGVDVVRACGVGVCAVCDDGDAGEDDDGRWTVQRRDEGDSLQKERSPGLPSAPERWECPAPNPVSLSHARSNTQVVGPLFPHKQANLTVTSPHMRPQTALQSPCSNSVLARRKARTDFTAKKKGGRAPSGVISYFTTPALRRSRSQCSKTKGQRGHHVLLADGEQRLSAAGDVIRELTYIRAHLVLKRPRRSAIAAWNLAVFYSAYVRSEIFKLKAFSGPSSSDLVDSFDQSAYSHTYEALPEGSKQKRCDTAVHPSPPEESSVRPEALTENVTVPFELHYGPPQLLSITQLPVNVHVQADQSPFLK
ncbi:hypothetical protein SCHPADRAFT_888389 [Schizopora paradoxa]|uniref:Uncharacterized protein n=1 Tax=Schizopora paradoxa TaxID=27342 RepID=A0A0H2RUR3_9AGAM|nr:hypothetical protein SCHPADRAFT_888389 [Schizopora paradoxa]